jgi:hypothetical protein
MKILCLFGLFIFTVSFASTRLPLVRLEKKVLSLDAVDGCKFEKNFQPKQPFVYILRSSDASYETAKIGSYFAYLGLDNDLTYSTEGFSASLKRGMLGGNSSGQVQDIGVFGRFKLFAFMDPKGDYFRVIGLLNASLNFKYFTTVFYRDDLVLVTKFDSPSSLDTAVAFEKKILSRLEEVDVPAEALAKIDYPVITPTSPVLSSGPDASGKGSPQEETPPPVITAQLGSELSVPHLCTPYERVFFACETVNQKLISLCSDPNVSDSMAYLQYRYGTKKKIELRFPKELYQSTEKFFYAHYSRAQTDYQTLSYKIGEVYYSVFDDFDGTSKSAVTAGVSVKKGPGTKEISIACKTPPYSQLSELSDFVSCDPDDALNMGTCK